MVKIEYERLIGNGTTGRWLFRIEWNGKHYCCEFQPNGIKYSRAAILGPGATREGVGEKMTAQLSEPLLDAVTGEITALTKQFGLYPALRRDPAKLKKDFGNFAAAAVLANCHPDETLRAELIGIMEKFFEKGLIEASNKNPFSYHFGDQSLGWFFMRETV